MGTVSKNVLIILVVLVLGVVLVGGGVWWLQRQENGAPGTGGVVEGPVIVTPSPIVQPTQAVREVATPTGVQTGVKTFTVEAKNLSFTPSTIKVKKGDTVVITFKSVDAIHDWVLDEFDASTNQIGEGEEEEIEFVADKKGTFEFYCSVENHRAMGMKGKFIVE